MGLFRGTILRKDQRSCCLPVHGREVQLSSREFRGALPGRVLPEADLLTQGLYVLRDCCWRQRHVVHERGGVYARLVKTC